jgi:hypothetical protein
VAFVRRHLAWIGFQASLSLRHPEATARHAKPVPVYV